MRACRDQQANALRGLPVNRLCALTAMELCESCEHELKVIGELGHRADGRSRGPHGIALIDRNCRGHTINSIDLRLVHPVKKLTCVGRKCLDIAALTLRVEGVKDQRALSRPGYASHNNQLA